MEFLNELIDKKIIIEFIDSDDDGNAKEVRGVLVANESDYLFIKTGVSYNVEQAIFKYNIRSVQKNPFSN